jgi:hypothetical protein
MFIYTTNSQSLKHHIEGHEAAGTLLPELRGLPHTPSKR